MFYFDFVGRAHLLCHGQVGDITAAVAGVMGSGFGAATPAGKLQAHHGSTDAADIAGATASHGVALAAMDLDGDGTTELFVGDSLATAGGAVCVFAGANAPVLFRSVSERVRALP